MGDFRVSLREDHIPTDSSGVLIPSMPSLAHTSLELRPQRKGGQPALHLLELTRQHLSPQVAYLPQPINRLAGLGLQPRVWLSDPSLQTSETSFAPKEVNSDVVVDCLLAHGWAVGLTVENP